MEPCREPRSAEDLQSADPRAAQRTRARDRLERLFGERRRAGSAADHDRASTGLSQRPVRLDQIHSAADLEGISALPPAVRQRALSIAWLCGGGLRLHAGCFARYAQKSRSLEAGMRSARWFYRRTIRHITRT